MDLRVHWGFGVGMGGAYCCGVSDERTTFSEPRYIESVGLWLVEEMIWVDGVCVVVVRHWSTNKQH